MIKAEIKLEPDSIVINKTIIAIDKRLALINLDNIQKAFKNRLFNELVNSPTYQSLINEGSPDSLAADFGFARGTAQSRANAIVQGIVNSVQISSKKRRRARTSVTTIKVRGVPNDYQFILENPASRYASNEFTIDWLEWLIIRGADTVVDDYTIINNLDDNQKKRSRSGEALMVKPGFGFSVRPEFQGIAKDNFITDAIKALLADPNLKQEIRNEIVRTLR